MDQFEIDEQNHALIEKFLGRVKRGEVISGIVTVRPDDRLKRVFWYPVDQDKSNELLDALSKIERL